MSGHPEVGGGRNDDFKSASEYAEFDVELTQESVPTKLEKTDIAPHAIEAGMTELVLQRHGAYVRDREAENTGSLSPESALVERAAATNYFEGFLKQLPESERGSVHLLVVSSDTRYFGKGQRSYETATIAQEVADETFEKYGVPAENIINNTQRLAGDGAPRPMPKLREPNFLDNSPDFMDFMLKEYGGINIDFWTAFEDDKHKDVREAMGAEGPDDIADRTAFTVRVLARYGQAFHKANPNTRLIIWAATHYDTISPFVKREVFGAPKEQQLMVDYGAGLTIDIDKEGNAVTELGGKQYEVPVKRK